MALITMDDSSSEPHASNPTPTIQHGNNTRPHLDDSKPPAMPSIPSPPGGITNIPRTNPFGVHLHPRTTAILHGFTRGLTCFLPKAWRYLLSIFHRNLTSTSRFLSHLAHLTHSFQPWSLRLQRTHPWVSLIIYHYQQCGNIFPFRNVMAPTLPGSLQR